MIWTKPRGRLTQWLKSTRRALRIDARYGNTWLENPWKSSVIYNYCFSMWIFVFCVIVHCHVWLGEGNKWIIPDSCPPHSDGWISWILRFLFWVRHSLIDKDGKICMFVWWVFNHVFFLFQASNSWHRIMIWLFYLSSSSSQQTFKTDQPSQTTLRQQLWQDRTKATAHRFPIAMATPEYVSCHRTSWREGVRVFTCMSHHFLLYSN